MFVSSTLEELAPERVAAREAIERLRLVPVMFELGARPYPPQDLYRAYLEQSHIFVGLYWQRYGWVAPDMDISGLEDEWRMSSSHPRLVYVKHAPERRDERLEELLGQIRDGGVSYRSFEGPDELRELLENDLALLLSERFETVGDATVDVRARTAPAPPEREPPGHRLPSPPSALIGRADELELLGKMLAQDDVRLVSITGAGGSGKTRLALELAARCRDQLGSRVAFVDLSGLRSSALVLPTIAAALGVKDAGEGDLVDAIASVMADASMLLVIDNFEHVMDAAPHLAEILSVTDDVTMLVTSRQALHLRWEHEFPLGSLDVPDPEQQVSVDAIAAASSVELLVERIRRVRPTFRLDASNAPVVADIVRRRDGLPLALELAAARLRMLQPADLLDRLERCLDELAATSPDMPVRHRTLRAAITWSHEQLSGPEQVVFRRLGVFADGASIEAVEAVCAGAGVETASVLDIVTGLVDKSLVLPVEASLTGAVAGGSRVTMLSTIREFAVEQLVEAGEAETTWDRHLLWHTSVAEQAWTGFWSPDMEAWLARVEVDRDNLRGALDHAAGSGDAMLGLRLGASLWPFWDVRGQYREGERRLRDLLAEADGSDSIERGRALSAQGWLVALMGDFERACELMQQGLPLVRRHGSKHQLAWSLAELGNVTFSLGRVEETRAMFSESQALAVEMDDAFLRGLGHFGLAYVAFLEGDLASMRAQLEQSLDLTRLMFQPWGIAWAQFSMGVLSIMEGDHHAAIGAITESLQMRWAIRDARGLAESIQLLATQSSAVGDVDWSALLHGAAELQREANGLTILPFLRPLHDESVERLRAALGDDELARRWQLGRSMPLEKLVPEALSRHPGLTV